MDEVKKNELFSRISGLDRQIKTINIYAWFLIVVLVIVWLGGLIIPNYYEKYGISLGLPPIVLIFIIYVMRVVAREYLRSRRDCLDKELEECYKE